MNRSHRLRSEEVVGGPEEGCQLLVGPALASGLGTADQGLVDQVEPEVEDAADDGEVRNGGQVGLGDRVVLAVAAEEGRPVRRRGDAGEVGRAVSLGGQVEVVQRESVV